jgi:hypothetical protein
MLIDTGPPTVIALDMLWGVAKIASLCFLGSGGHRSPNALPKTIM